MYVSQNFASKAALKRAVLSGEVVTAYSPGGSGGQVAKPGASVAIEGPWYPKPHSWYAVVVLGEGNKVEKVKA